MSREPIFNTINNGGAPNGNDGDQNDLGGKPDLTNGSAEPAATRSSFVSPGSIGNSGGGGNGGDSITGEPERKRRKYTKRAGKGGSQNAQSIPVEGLATILLQGHAMLAMITKTQEFMLSADESITLAQSLANVSRHYDVEIAAKTLDWTNLIMVAGTMYGSRLATIRIRKQMERAQRPQPETPLRKTGEEIVQEYSGSPPADFEPGMGAHIQ